jgi:glycosyltransferase involved in cell wall biosynthesis
MDKSGASHTPRGVLIIMSNRSIVAIVWAPPGSDAHAKADAKFLNAKLYSIHYLKHQRPIYAPFKYILQWIKTWYVLLRERPDVIYVQNSPPVAGLCVFVYCRFSRTPFILNTHTPILFVRKWRWTRPLVRLMARHALVNILDQEQYKRLFESWGAKAVILRKPPAAVPAELVDTAVCPDALEFAYVGTFDGDEPVEIILEAARSLPNMTFFLLGKKERARREWLDTAPDNVVFTDYLKGGEYWRRLMRSRAIIALTAHEYSLLAAAQDGMYVDTPLILSDQPVLREYFSQGAVFIPNTAQGLIDGLKAFLEREAIYRQEIAELHHERQQEWKANSQLLMAALDS